MTDDICSTFDVRYCKSDAMLRLASREYAVRASHVRQFEEPYGGEKNAHTRASTGSVALRHPRRSFSIDGLHGTAIWWDSVRGTPYVRPKLAMIIGCVRDMLTVAVLLLGNCRRMHVADDASMLQCLARPGTHASNSRNQPKKLRPSAVLIEAIQRLSYVPAADSTRYPSHGRARQPTFSRVKVNPTHHPSASSRT